MQMLCLSAKRLSLPMIHVAGVAVSLALPASRIFCMVSMITSFVSGCSFMKFSSCSSRPFPILFAAVAKCRLAVSATPYIINIRLWILLEIILQRKVQNRTLVDFIAPQPLPCADMVGKAALPEMIFRFWRSCEDICPGEQTARHRRSALVGGLIQLCHGNGMKIMRAFHASDFLNAFPQYFPPGIAFAGFMWYALVS